MKGGSDELRAQVLQRDAEIMENLRAFYERGALNALSELANLVNISLIASHSGWPGSPHLLKNVNYLTAAVIHALKLDEKKACADIDTIARTRRIDL